MRHSFSEYSLFKRDSTLPHGSQSSPSSKIFTSSSSNLLCTKVLTIFPNAYFFSEFTTNLNRSSFSIFLFITKLELSVDISSIK